MAFIEVIYALFPSLRKLTRSLSHHHRRTVQCTIILFRIHAVSIKLPVQCAVRFQKISELIPIHHTLVPLINFSGGYSLSVSTVENII